MLQRIRNVLQATWRRCCNIARTSFKGLEEDVTTSCMEHVGRAAQKMSQCSRSVPASHSKKMLQRIRNIWQVTVRRGRQDVSGRSFNLLKSRKMLQRIRNVLQATWRRCLQNSKNIIQGTWRRCDNVMHGTWRKGRAEDVTMQQERVASHSKRMLQRIRNIWQVSPKPTQQECPQGRPIYLQVGRCCTPSGMYCKLLDEDVAK